MNDLNVEEKLISIHEDGRKLATLFATSLFPMRFAKIAQVQADKWMKSKISTRWTLAAVVPVMGQRISIFGTESQKRRLKRSDGTKILEQAIRNRYKNGLHLLQTLNL